MHCGLDWFEPCSPPPAPSLGFGGEFRQAAAEKTYRTDRLGESLRLLRLVFRYAALANLLFLFNDWRFFGQPHFPVALSARGVLILASLAGLVLLPKIHSFAGMQKLGVGWSLPAIAASTALVSPHTDVALFITYMLPIVFYLALPLSFAWTMSIGAGCSIATLAAYMAPVPWSGTSYGLILAMATSNTVLALVLARANRLQRLEWAAHRAVAAANQELTEHRRMLQTLLRAVPAPLLITTRKGDRLIQANDAAKSYFGPDAQGDTFNIRKYSDSAGSRKIHLTPPQEGQITEAEARLRLADGRFRDVLLVTTQTMANGLEAVLTIVVDITRRKELEAHLRELATTDPLTGLANRTLFCGKAADEIRRAKRHGRPLAVIMLDIDYFKHLNDTHGHDTGDAALKAFADLSRTMVRAQDVVARIGGEEFALLLPETDRPGALGLADRLRLAVAGLRLGNGDATMTISLGVSDIRPGETTVDAALHRADQALYRAKAAGRNQVMDDAGPTCPAPLARNAANA